MSKVRCYFYITESGRSPAEAFINSLDFRTRKKFYYMKSLLEEFGRQLVYPHMKYIGDEIFELRFTGIEGPTRVLYFFFEQDKVIFTNGFIKKSNKTPKKEKELGVKRRKEFLNSRSK